MAKRNDRGVQNYDDENGLNDVGGEVGAYVARYIYIEESPQFAAMWTGSGCRKVYTRGIRNEIITRARVIIIIYINK